MDRTTPIEVTEVALSQARQCGLQGDVRSRVIGLARSSVPTEHQVGNRVYGPFVMRVSNGVVQSFTMIGPRVMDERPVHDCKLCQGYMVLVVDKRGSGEYGKAAHPCPRAHDPTAPLCDTLVKRTKL